MDIKGNGDLAISFNNVCHDLDEAETRLCPGLYQRQVSCFNSYSDEHYMSRDDNDMPT